MFSLPIVEVLVGIILAVLGTASLPGLAALMAVESFGIPPLPSEVILLFSGFLVAQGVYSFEAAFVVALAGSVAGSFLGYWAGRDARAWLFPAGRPPRVPVDPEALARMDRWFARHGEGTVAFARLVPVIRSYISYPAGAARMRPVLFGLFTTAGAAPFTLAFLYAGVRLGSAWKLVVPYLGYVDDAAVASIVLLVVLLFLRWHGAQRVRPAASGSLGVSDGLGGGESGRLDGGTGDRRDGEPVGDE